MTRKQPNPPPPGVRPPPPPNPPPAPAKRTILEIKTQESKTLRSISPGMSKESLKQAAMSVGLVTSVDILERGDPGVVDLMVETEFELSKLRMNRLKEEIEKVRPCAIKINIWVKV